MKKACIPFLILLAVLFTFTGCSAGNAKGGTDKAAVNSPGIESAEGVIELIRENSSLKHLPGDTYMSVDTDGFTLSEEGQTHVFSNDVIGVEYTFTGSQDVEECTLSSLTINEMGYAIFGITVGASPDDAEKVLTSYGFKKDKRDDLYIYSLNGISITLGYRNKNITYITIGK